MTEPTLTLVDGRPSNVVPAANRGLAYGDGVFETIRVLAGEPVLMALHVERLLAGCARLGIAVAGLADALAVDTETACAAAPESAVMKVIVTRAAGGRGYTPAPDAGTCRVVTVSAYAPDTKARDDGIDLMLCRTRLAIKPALAGIKHLGRLEQVLAAAELEGAREGLMLDMEGQVVEGTKSNVFRLTDGELLTPPVDRCGIAGVMRRYLIDECGAREQGGGLDTFLAASEVFVCNSVFGIYPVRRLGSTSWPVGDVTRELAARVAREVGTL